MVFIRMNFGIYGKASLLDPTVGTMLHPEVKKG